jgi:deoxycytidylate deaminase
VSVGNAVSAEGIIVADGSIVSVGATGKEAGAAHETINNIQIMENKNLGWIFEFMELILLDLELSLNN